MWRKLWLFREKIWPSFEVQLGQAWMCSIKEDLETYGDHGDLCSHYFNKCRVHARFEFQVVHSILNTTLT